MDKINFENWPSTETPLSAEILNQLQTNIENAINATSDYSSIETIVGTWINGKPIYRKVIDIGNLPNDDIKNVAHNISNLGFVSRLYLAITSGISFYNANMAGTSTIYSGGTVVVRATNDNIQIGTTHDYSSHSGYAIIEYTKTTD